MILQSNPFAIALFLFSAALALLSSLLAWSHRSATTVDAEPTLDWAEALFVASVGVVVFTGWLAVILASFGSFSLPALSLSLLGGAGVLLWLHRPLPRLRFARIGVHEAFLLLLLAGFSVIYFRPHEYILGGSDAGSYMNIGATTARTGEFVIHDDWTSILREHAPVTLRRHPPQWKPEYLQFVGWYIDDDNPSRVIPQFFPFHPILLAVGIALGGLYGGLLVTPLWGVLGLAAIYFLGRKLFGPHIGLLAAVLLALTPTQIYFARYPTTEPLTLLLVFTALFAFQQLYEQPEATPAWGVLGGAVLGAALLTRIDLPVVALLFLGALVLLWQQQRWSTALTAFTVTFTLFSLQAITFALLISWPYTWNTYSSVFSLLAASIPLAPLGGTVGLVIVLLFFFARKGRPGAYTRFFPARYRWLLAVAVVLLSAYAYFLRPLLEPTIPYPTWPAGTEAMLLNGENWVRLGWYLTPLGLLLATAGAAWLLWRGRLGRLGLFMSISLLTTIQYVYQIFNTPSHIYAMRRYVPIVIPALMIYAAVALVTIFRVRPSWHARALGAFLTLALMAGLLYQARYVLPLREFEGAVAEVRALNEKLEPGALVIISEPPESIFADTFGVPLRFIFGHDIATIRADDPQVLSFIEDMRAHAVSQGRPLQLIAVEAIPATVRNNLSLQPLEMFPARFELLEGTFTSYPSTIQTAYYGIELYDVAGTETALSASETLNIDVGSVDAAYVDSGFYYKEPLPGPTTMRWTTDEATLSVPLAETTPVTIDVRAMIYRPDGVPPAAVTVSLDGRRIGRFTPRDAEWHTFSFQAETRPTNGTSRLSFETTTFNPAVLGVNNDTRDLGFLIDWVKITTD